MISGLRSRVVACVLVLFSLMGTTGAWHADDDPDCAGITAHDHSAHHERWNRSTRTQPPVHCAICHWLQGFRTGSIPMTTAGDRDIANRLVLAPARTVRQFLVSVDVPSRAPPAQFS